MSSLSAQKHHVFTQSGSFATLSRRLPTRLCPLCRRKRKHSIGAAAESAFTLTLQSEYPTTTQQERNTIAETVTDG